MLSRIAAKLAVPEEGEVFSSPVSLGLANKAVAEISLIGGGGIDNQLTATFYGSNDLQAWEPLGDIIIDAAQAGVFVANGFPTYGFTYGMMGFTVDGSDVPAVTVVAASINSYIE